MLEFMYKHYFGLKESPFQLVPNPAYLFLSRSHEEALAHLTYAINHGDGFVLITGEVGTGKTTLCRAFLDNLNENTEAAYIFNPNLNSLELLKTINDEFGIDSKGENHKELIDTLNVFLMEKKAIGKKILLLIDEAQNLSKSVLEQLRLLSNLETNVSKLLQIILVGQPELGEMLASYELRQLGQRITLSCQIIPLNFKECRDYIQHRIHTASRGSVIKFTRNALYSIYRYSRGIPRRINIVCDRALLTAYGLNRHRITGAIARSAIKELSGWEKAGQFRLTSGKAGAVWLSLLCVVLLYVLLYPPLFKSYPVLTSVQINKRKATAPLTSYSVLNAISHGISSPLEKVSIGNGMKNNTRTNRSLEPLKPVHHKLTEYLKHMDGISSRKNALQTVFTLWSSDSSVHPNLDTIEKDKDYFRIAAKQKGFLISQIDCEFELVKHLNLPAILGLKISGSGLTPYLTITNMDDSRAILIEKDTGDVIEATLEEMESYCSGAIYVLYKDFFSCTGTIPGNAPNDSILTLKLMLKEIGFNEMEMNPVYDKAAEYAVKTLQEKHHIPVDGIVGTLTKMVLYNEISMLEIPHISEKSFN